MPLLTLFHALFCLGANFELIFLGKRYDLSIRECDLVSGNDSAFWNLLIYKNAA